MANVNGSAIIGSIVSLGNDQPFQFYKTEVPAELGNGGEQVLAVHRFSGSRRTIDSFGVHPDPLSWSGVLYSMGDIPQQGERPPLSAQLAITRSETLRSLAQLRTPVTFRFHTYSWRGVIRSYKPVIHSVNKVSYTITFEILSEDLRPQTDFLTASPFVLRPDRNVFDLMLLDFLALVRNIANYIQLAASVAAFTSALVVALETDPASVFYKGLSLVPGSTQMLELLTAARAYISSANTLQNVLLPQFYADKENGRPFNTLQPEAFSKVYTPQAEAILAELKIMQVYMLENAVVTQGAVPRHIAMATVELRNAQNAIQKLLKHYNNVQRPFSAKKLRISNPNLYELASVYYGDVSAWNIIARANGLTSPIPPDGDYELNVPTLGNAAGTNVNARAAV